MINFRMLKLSDLLLWIATGALILIGFLAIFSSTYSMQLRAAGDPWFFVKRQLLSLLVGGAGLAIFAYIDYKHLKRVSFVFYALMLVLLVLILFVGGGRESAQRWFQIGIFSFQPSELSKIVIVLCLAAFLSARQKMKSLWDGLLLLGLIGVPFLLIFKQPDLGTALVFIFIMMGMLASSEFSSKLLLIMVTPIISILLRPFFYVWIGYLVLLAVVLFMSKSSLWDWILILGVNIAVGVALPYIWGLLKGYQRQRILSFLDPSSDPQGAGYHGLQSLIAVGSGGFFGKGFLRGTQTQLQFIPEQHSDFVFAAIGEEFGFLGAAVVLALFALFIWRALAIAGEANDPFGYLLASGIVSMTAFHVFANIGMTLGLLPVVGMPLPFMSFGGSSLMMNMIAVGMLQSIAMRRRKIIF
jgi:rod shape determining protein RodA